MRSMINAGAIETAACINKVERTRVDMTAGVLGWGGGLICSGSYYPHAQEVGASVINEIKDQAQLRQ